MFSFFRDSNKKTRYIYLDHASATPVDPLILKTCAEIQELSFANPGSIHRLGIQAKTYIGKARKKIAHALQARPDEIIFTSSATEANNFVIAGVIQRARREGILLPHIVTTSIEHASVLEPLYVFAQANKIRLSVIPVDSTGIVDLKTIKDALTPETVLVSVIHANNEIGTIQPVREVGKMIEKYKEAHGTMYPYFHVDACQAINYLDVRPEAFRIDFCTLNSSKMYAPRGVGILYMGRQARLDPQIIGGNQEYGYRAGTENTSAIVACAEAIEQVLTQRHGETARLQELQVYALSELKKRIPNLIVWGSEHKDQRLPNNINISIPGIFSEELVVGLDMAGIAISSKSACGMSNTDGSYVIRALGGTEQDSKESIRISMGRSTSKKDIDRLIQEIEKIIYRASVAKKYS